MTDTPSLLKPGSAVPYVLVAALFFVAGVALILGILYLRPQLDALSVIGAVGGLASLLFGLVANFMKSQETHATVNNFSTEAMAKQFSLAHAEGMLQGASEEQSRIAKQAVMSAALAPSVPPTNGEPAPVKIVAAVPVPVKETPGGKS